MERTFSAEERASALTWLYAEVYARKQQRAAIREWLGLSSEGSQPIKLMTPPPFAMAAAPNAAATASEKIPNPIMGLGIGEDRFQKAKEMLQILTHFDNFSAVNPQNTTTNLQGICQELRVKLDWVVEYVRSIMLPNGKINPTILLPLRLKSAGIRSVVWKRTMHEMEDLMQLPGWSTNYLGQAYDVMSLIDGLMPAAL